MRAPPRAPRTVLLVALGLLVRTAAASGEVRALERARRAVGAWSAADTVVVGHGTASVSGADGELLVVFAADGSFRVQVDSALPDWSGFDGRTAWKRDQAGLGRPLELEEKDRLELVSWVLSGRWLDGGDVLVSPSGDGALELSLVGSPLVATLRLDEETGLPAELSLPGDTGPRRVLLEDWRDVGGRRLPHAWARVDGPVEELYEVEAYERAAPDPARFAPALDPPGDVAFDADAPAALEVTRAPGGYLLVEPWLDGEPRGAFFFDTGAGITVVDRGLADELGLEVLGETQAVGVAGATTTRFRRGTSFRLGPVELRDPVYGDLDLSFLAEPFGRPIAGIVGYDLVARCVVELEPAEPAISLFDPARYELAGGSWGELVLSDNHPCALGRFATGAGEPHEGLFRLDSGAGGTLTFHAPLVDALGLLEGRALTAGTSGGVGGIAAAPQGTIPWFELAGHRFEEPRVAFSRATAGAFTDRYLAGNVGQEFLEAFRIVLDVPHDRLALLARGDAAER